MEPKTTGKRIVSKDISVKRSMEIVYVRKLRSLYLVFIAAPVFSLLSALYAAICHQAAIAVLFIAMALAYSPVMWMLFRTSHKIIEKTIEDREQYLDSLPNPNRLVRASEEPKQAQEAVLLRAAAEGQETPPEQLVRASVRQE